VYTIYQVRFYVVKWLGCEIDHHFREVLESRICDTLFSCMLCRHKSSLYFMIVGGRGSTENKCVVGRTQSLLSCCINFWFCIFSILYKEEKRTHVET
jgi:hypothetical protein